MACRRNTPVSHSTTPKLEIEIVDLEEASCCPDPIYFKSSDKLDWLTVAARNLCLAEEKGLDIFSNCSGCTATLSETYHLLDDQALPGNKKVGCGRQTADFSLFCLFRRPGNTFR